MRSQVAWSRIMLGLVNPGKHLGFFPESHLNASSLMLLILEKKASINIQGEKLGEHKRGKNGKGKQMGFHEGGINFSSWTVAMCARPPSSMCLGSCHHYFTKTFLQ